MALEIVPSPLFFGGGPYSASHAADVPRIVAFFAEDEGVPARLRGGDAQAVENPDLQGGRIVDAVFSLLFPKEVDDIYPALLDQGSGQPEVIGAIVLSASPRVRLRKIIGYPALNPS
ncbi:MAG TPA: hypothetical protein PLG75_02830 [Methanoculleus sp.]|nr:hypothetical protein [Methanoculleus sp.]